MKVIKKVSLSFIIATMCGCTFIPASYKHQQFWDNFSSRRYPSENAQLVNQETEENKVEKYFGNDHSHTEIPQGSSDDFISYYDMAEEITNKFEVFKEEKPKENLYEKSQTTSSELKLSSIPQNPLSAKQIENIQKSIKLISGFSA